MWRDRLRRRPRYNSSSRTPERVKKSRQLVKLAKFIFIGLIALFLASFIILPLLAFNLPSPDKIVRTQGYSTKILDRNGEVLYDIYQDKRQTPVNLDQMPLYLRQATIAIEDKNFYSHQGFDPRGSSIRAIYNFVFFHKFQLEVISPNPAVS